MGIRGRLRERCGGGGSIMVGWRADSAGTLIRKGNLEGFLNIESESE